jgi:hypothetical protein
MNTFSKTRFLELKTVERRNLCSELAKSLSRNIASAANFHRETRRLVEELRAVGHDLWSIDEADDYEVWGPNYEAPTGAGIVVTFSADGDVEVEWAEE